MNENFYLLKNSLEPKKHVHLKRVNGCFFDKHWNSKLEETQTKQYQYITQNCKSKPNFEADSILTHAPFVST
jgi:hypothetical protein